MGLIFKSPDCFQIQNFLRLIDNWKKPHLTSWQVTGKMLTQLKKYKKIYNCLPTLYTGNTNIKMQIFKNPGFLTFWSQALQIRGAPPVIHPYPKVTLPRWLSWAFWRAGEVWPPVWMPSAPPDSILLSFACPVAVNVWLTGTFCGTLPYYPQESVTKWFLTGHEPEPRACVSDREGAQGLCWRLQTKQTRRVSYKANKLNQGHVRSSKIYKTGS